MFIIHKIWLLAHYIITLSVTVMFYVEKMLNFSLVKISEDQLSASGPTKELVCPDITYWSINNNTLLLLLLLLLYIHMKDTAKPLPLPSHISNVLILRVNMV